VPVSRPRKQGRSNWPPNLYTNPLRYRNPATGKITSWRKYTVEKAIEAAKILNSMLVQSDPISDVIGDKDSLGKFLLEFLTTHLPSRKQEWGLSDSTVRDYTNKVKVLQNEKLAKRPIAEITTYDLAQLLKQFPTTQRNRYRSLLILIFGYAIGEGLVANNPASTLLKKKEKVRRQRLTIEGFNAVYEAADIKTQSAMRLGLRSLQRREDLVTLKMSDISSDERGKYLPLIQIKTKAAVKIYLDKALEDDIDRCRDDVVSPYILHYGMESNKRRRAKPLTPDRLTKGFTKYRDVIPFFADVPKEQRPTFHEIRALGAILYLRAGKPLKDIQKLCGHKDEATTRRYLERHGVEFVDAETGTFCTNIERILHAPGFVS
jgi:integrase